MFDRVLFDDGTDFTTKTSFNHGQFFWELCEFFENFCRTRKEVENIIATFELWFKIPD